MVRAIAYIRVSTDRQATDGSSLVTQRRRVVEYAALKGYQLLKQFVEEGESAKSDNRPVLKQMLRYCEEERGQIDLLVVPKIDRFARYSEDYHHLKRQLRNLGIRVESIDERFDDSPAGKFLESMLAATAQFDNDVRSERTYNGMREAVSQGRWVWKAPTGYRNVRIDGRANIEPDPRTAPLVIEAFEKLSRKVRISDVREWLNEHGVPIRRNGFYKMIRNKVYIGVIEAFGVTSRSVLPFTPIVPIELFESAQAAIAESNYPGEIQRDHKDFPLRGTVRCKCGQLLTACWSKGRKRRYAYYRCRKCPRVNLARGFIEDQFIRRLQLVGEELTLSDEMVSEMRSHWEREQLQLGKLHEDLARERERIEGQQANLVRKVADNIVPDRLAQQMFDEYESKLRRINARLSKLGSRVCEPQLDCLIEFGTQFLQDIDSKWQTASMDVKKQIQAFLFPHGSRLVESTSPRTDQLDGSTDVVEPQFMLNAHVGGPQRQLCEPTLVAGRLEFYRDLYQAFGRKVN